MRKLITLGVFLILAAILAIKGFLLLSVASIGIFVAILVLLLVFFLVVVRVKGGHRTALEKAQKSSNTKHGPTTNDTNPNTREDSLLKRNTEKIKKVGSTGFIVVGLSIFFFLAFFTNVDLSPVRIYEWTSSTLVGVIGIFIVCGAAWYGFPNNNKIRFLGVFVGGTLLTTMLVGWWTDDQINRLPDNSFWVDAHSNSRQFATHPGLAISFSGDDFTTHCIYRDGRRGIVGSRFAPCDNGPMAAVYVHNNKNTRELFSFKYVKP